MKLIREQDDFDWIRDIPIDIPFTNLEIGKLYRIETTEVLREALVACSKSERLLHAYMGIPAMKSKDEYNQIFCDHEREGRVDSVYLEFYDNNHGDLGSFWVTEDMVKFYFLKSDIKESEEDDFGWIRDTGNYIDMFINKAFYFDPVAEEGDKDYTKLVNYLINLGFESQYGTPKVLGRGSRAVGLYVYRDFGGDLNYVFTGELGDYEDYEEHIKGYAEDESEDYGENLEVVNAREFIKLI
jgi:hypothetical protein